MWVAGALAFIVGTEIRVRAEDRLLEQRFGLEFRNYRSRVPAYIPFFDWRNLHLIRVPDIL